VNFLEAQRVLAEFEGGEPLPYLFALSGTPEPFIPYLGATAVLRSREARVKLLPFNTLGQELLDDIPREPTEVFLLLPWDLIPEADWRSGVPLQLPDESELRAVAEATLARLQRRGASIVYIPAPLPPLWLDPRRVRALDHWLRAGVCGVGGDLVSSDVFSLDSYMASGCPVGGGSLSLIADLVTQAAARPRPESSKVLVTDLDNTLWAGVVGDDGLEGIQHGPEGRGFPHFLYQTFLKRLESEGVLLAAVSRNDSEVALAPFRTGRMVLAEENFVAIVASWSAKSAQLLELARELNLATDALVFVDDNPIELAEVELELPQVKRVAFPGSAAELPKMLSQLSGLFAREAITEEDRARTSLYRQRLAGLAPREAQGADLTKFLRDLRMTLTVHDRSSGSRSRALQLINKTNQFNLNGRRLTEEQLEAALTAGGRLYTASLSDRTGSHGEILACLMDANGVITSLVMSCRTFQRRVEYAFLAWLASGPHRPTSLDYLETERNRPMRQFLDDFGGRPPVPLMPFDAAEFVRRHGSDLSLFEIEEPASV
jgi:FkbH-like protein